MIFKGFIFFIFSTACLFANGIELSLKTDNDTTRLLLAKDSSSQNTLTGTPKITKYSLPDSNVDNPQAKGLILAFNKWPDDEEKAVILKKMTTAGLEKKTEIQRFKVWIFEWPKLHEGAEAQKLCKELSNLSSLKHCEPDYTVSPDVQADSSSSQKQETINQGGTNYIMLRNWVNNRGLSIASLIGFLSKKNIQILQIDNPEIPALRAAGKSYSPTIHAIPNTSANRNQLEQFAQGLSSSYSPKSQQLESQEIERPVRLSNTNPQTEIDPDSRGDLKSCNIVFSQAGLFEDRLSDYWAQELIGADLLREELEKAPPIEKHLVEVFDSPTRNHDIGVRNLISDEGQNAVFPELGDKAGITHTLYASMALTEVNRLLNKADQVCTAGTETPDQGSSSQQGSSTSQQGSTEVITFGGIQHTIVRRDETSSYRGTNYIFGS